MIKRKNSTKHPSYTSLKKIYISIIILLICSSSIFFVGISSPITAEKHTTRFVASPSVEVSQENNHIKTTSVLRYTQGSIPQKLLSPSEYLAQLHNNWGYLLASFLIFISIVLLAVYGGIKKKTKRPLRKTVPFISIIIFAVIVLLFSLWDMMYQEQWLERIIALYGILIVLTLLFLVSTEKKKPMVVQTAEEFKKSLKGTLHHFRCPSCGGMFAIKKSKQNNKKAFTLTCPDCGTTGLIPSTPSQIVGDIPEKKSIHKNFTCKRCGEWIMVWAEGTDILPDLHVFSCPYCGTKNEMCRT